MRCIGIECHLDFEKKRKKYFKMNVELVDYKKKISLPAYPD